MFQAIRERLKQGHRTMAYPDGPAPAMPDRFRGLPILDQSKCQSGCSECVSACPTDAISQTSGNLQVDLGRCLFCTDCEEACPAGAVGHSTSYALATSRREDLIFGGQELQLAQALKAKSLKLFGRSLKLRQVSAGGCNGCESDVNVLNTVVFDLGRFGIKFVASPRHADGLLITGPITQNMKLALQKTYAAVATPKIVIAVGACAISGGPFAGLPDQAGGVEGILPIDLYVPGCPPHPMTILDGLLRLLDRLGSRAANTDWNSY
jgi:Ni,Fe-hydrogenase III small subunit/Pyruvate/2-oxoacid:ferredoxin oxidoreductase delta subunit